MVAGIEKNGIIIIKFRKIKRGTGHENMGRSGTLPGGGQKKVGFRGCRGAAVLAEHVA
ncbi:hypothetical protein KKC1_26090 [Calderihabitans maritimus]|uniref:Uncharacterized protein n=1 Tax=Calderihabitans maritimus TaxID=1246530 RepID=A0A1Z5HVB2_9FIRM|nr:hypothetical protein KKC1_26090 [Calderihabitans maritimus]